MSDKEKQEMLEKLLAEGLSQEEAEAQVLQASAEDAEEPTEDDTEDAQEPVEEDASDDVDAEEVQSEESGQIDQSDERVDAIDEQPDSQDGENEEQQQTFDRSYVEKLRKEAAKYRDKAKRAEELEQRLHQALVAQDGRLADPSDLPFDETHLDDPDALAAAIAKLIARKPGLKAQKLSGDVGAGKRSSKKSNTDLLSIMKGLI